MEHPGEWRESGKGPPSGGDDSPWRPSARVTSGSGVLVGAVAAGDRPDVGNLTGAPRTEAGNLTAGSEADAGNLAAGSRAEAGRVAAAEWRGRVRAALRERMPVWLQARCGLERRSVVALSVLLVVAAVFAVQHFWTGRTQSVRAPEVVQAAVPYGTRERNHEAGSTVSTGAPSPVGTPGPEVVVDVTGKVRKPGIHRLPAGSRVADALRAAGGVRHGTDTDDLNRARFLVDGEQIVVGAPAPAAAQGAGGTGAGAPAGSGPGAGPAAPVSLSTATVGQLDTLPGVGPVLAQHIVDYRTQHGGFRTVDELREVNGIGDRRFADLRDLVRP